MLENNPLKTEPYILSRSFYLRPTLEVAADLIGKILVFEKMGYKLAGRIVETEAYLGCEDPAAHSFKGITPRCEAMFLGGGHAYVYFTYGVHHCFNIVTEKKSTGHAVLVRALEPLMGMDLMKKRRKTSDLKNLCSGPGKLCEAFGITLKENGLDLCKSELNIRNAPLVKNIVEDIRIGISKNKEVPWRFFERDSPFISKSKRS